MMRGVIGFAGLALTEAVTTVQMAVGKAGDLSVADNLELCVEDSITAVSKECVCGASLKDGNKISADTAALGETWCYGDNNCVPDGKTKCPVSIKGEALRCNHHQWAGEKSNRLACHCNHGENDNHPKLLTCAAKQASGNSVSTNKWCYDDPTDKVNGHVQKACQEFPKCSPDNGQTLEKKYKDVKSFTKCMCNDEACAAANYCLAAGANRDSADGLCSANAYCSEGDDKAVGKTCATGFQIANPDQINVQSPKIDVETCTADQFFYEFAGSKACRGTKKGHQCQCSHGTGAAAGRSTAYQTLGQSMYEVNDVISDGCATDATEKCVKCDPGYVLDSGSGKCELKKCLKSDLCKTEAKGEQCRNTAVAADVGGGCQECTKNAIWYPAADHESNPFCVAPRCTCDNGVVDTTKCTANNQHLCTTDGCDTGYKHKDGKCERDSKLKDTGDECKTADDCMSGTCTDKKCAGTDQYPQCANGRSFAGVCGKADGSLCALGFTQEGSGASATCKMNTCECTNGKAWDGDDAVQCNKGKQDCKTCNRGFHSAPTFASNIIDRVCTVNVCTCHSKGTAATGEACKYHNANICTGNTCTDPKYKMQTDVLAWLSAATMNIQYTSSYCKNTCAASGGGCSTGGKTPVNGEYPGLWTENNGDCCDVAGAGSLTCSSAAISESGQTFLKNGFFVKDEKGNQKYTINTQTKSPNPIFSCQTAEQIKRSTAHLNSARHINGKNCKKDNECKSQNCVNSQCAAPGVCTSDTDCKANQYCKRGAANAANTCAATIARDQACDSADAVTAGSTRQCAFGNKCPGTGANQKCPKANDNQDCATSAGCDAGSYCNADKKCAKKIENGQACTSGGDAAQCKSGKACPVGANSVCPAAKAGKGDACSATVLCDANLFCKTIAGASTCAEKIAAGAVCAAASDTCATTGQTCKDKSGVGAGAVCANDAACNNNDCPAAAGAAATKSCEKDRDCLSNSCTGTAGSKTCAAGADVQTCGAGAAVKTCQAQ